MHTAHQTHQDTLIVSLNCVRPLDGSHSDLLSFLCGSGVRRHHPPNPGGAHVHGHVHPLLPRLHPLPHRYVRQSTQSCIDYIYNILYTYMITPRLFSSLYLTAVGVWVCRQAGGGLRVPVRLHHSVLPTRHQRRAHRHRRTRQLWRHHTVSPLAMAHSPTETGSPLCPRDSGMRGTALGCSCSSDHARCVGESGANHVVP